MNRLMSGSSREALVNRRASFLVLATCLTTCLVGCAGAANDFPLDGGPPPPPPAPPDVPLELPELTLTGSCVDVAEGERVVGVGVGGEAWLATGDAVRVVTPAGEVTDLDLGAAASVVRPWTAADGAFAVGARLYVREGGRNEEVRWPAALGAIVDLCGDPRYDGAFVLGAGAGDQPAGLYRRDGGEWWHWTPQTGDLGTMRGLATIAGACGGSDDRAWLRTESGLWSLHTDALEHHTELAGVTELAIDPSVGVAVRAEERLLFRRDGAWRETRFAAGPVTHLAGTAGRLWVVAGERLHHFAEGSFHHAVVELPGNPRALHPDASGGLWIEVAGQLCHRAPAAPLRVVGLRPFERRTSREVSLRLEGAGEVEVRLDGVTEAEGTLDDGLEVVLEDLGEPGWHRVDVLTSSEERHLDVLVIDTHVPSWAEDVEPLYVAHCAGSSCHGPEVTRRPRLDRYEDWVELADVIRERIGVVGDMPPVETREDWGATEVTTVVAWIAAGMEE